MDLGKIIVAIIPATLELSSGANISPRELDPTETAHVKRHWSKCDVAMP